VSTVLSDGTSTSDGDPPRTTRRRWLLPAAIVVLWIAAWVPLSGLAGQLDTVQRSGFDSSLPSGAESAEVATAVEAVRTTETVPAILIWEADDRIDREILRGIRAALVDVDAIEGVDTETSRLIVSEDDQAVQAVVPLDVVENTGADVSAIVDEILATMPVEGTTSAVTGPGGLIADIGKAFGNGGPDPALVGAFTVVLIILLVVYRSPILPALVLATAGFALFAAEACVYLLAKAEWVEVDGTSIGIASILVVGAATDYGLLLVARYREELRRHSSKYSAMWIAWRRSVEPIVASGATVLIGVLCLGFSVLPSNRSLAPVLAASVIFSVIAALTFLPAALVLIGRAAFWPVRPKLGSEAPEVSGVWGRISRTVGRRPVAVAATTLVVLLAAAALAPMLKAEGVSDTDQILGTSQAAVGQAALERHFPAGDGTPTTLLASPDSIDEVTEAAVAVDGVARVEPLRGAVPVEDGRVQLGVILDDPPDSAAAIDTIGELRAAVSAVDPQAQVGGYTAERLDTNTAATRDRNVIIPIVLVVVTLLLALLLRALVAPMLIIATVVLSFVATLGISAVAFNYLFDFPGSSPIVPLFAFVFLVALGVDYNIFLMTRVREESVRHGTRKGVLLGLAVTGGVITSAGLVLAGTFGALALFPILLLAQIAFIVALGVLIDTLVVRSLTLPALVHIVGDRVWWPSALARPAPRDEAAPDEQPELVSK
jgi:RND superfamily putative drug exporter